MQVTNDIFKAYDIRGKYPRELSLEVAGTIGKSFVRLLNAKTIGVGRDGRASSPALLRAFCDGVRSQGCDVIDLGEITTPMLYFVVSHFQYDGGAMITASHNPEEDNGMKLVREKAIPIGQENGLRWIQTHLTTQWSDKTQGHTQKKSVKAPYAKYMKVPKNLKSFPFQVSFDGDGDRIFFEDEKGKRISGDLITALVAKIVLEKQNAKILYDIRSSNIVRETIARYGGTPVVSRVGHTFIKHKMRKENILFAGEFSGHYYWGEGLYYETPFLILSKILDYMRTNKKQLHELIKPFQKYFHSGEVNFRVQDAEKKMQAIKKHYIKGIVTGMDGVRVDFPDWWFLVRPSNTEPLLRLIVEAKTKLLMQEKLRDLQKFINK